MKKQDKSVAVSPAYQWLFVIAVLGGWAVETLAVAHQLASHYTSHGTWLFQASTWLFPALIFIASLGFAARRYRTWLRRVFFGTLLIAVVMSVYGALEWVDIYWYNAYSQNHPLGDNASYWQIFGYQWGLMIAVLAAYIVCLLWADKGRQ
ncbi:MAG TPA: hypothetical protein VGM08_02180 [Candidatus Saccharimonadales bacterium]|jgi:hypothetical protein